MRKIIVLLVILWFSLACSRSTVHVRSEEITARRYSSVEILLSDSSKKVTAYYEKRGIQIPDDFNGEQFIEVLEEVYPDQDRVESLKDSFRIEARSIEDSYSVMLCDPKTGSKVMEDFSCNLSKVEVRHWDTTGTFPCEFEEDWEPYCE